MLRLLLPADQSEAAFGGCYTPSPSRPATPLPAAAAGTPHHLQHFHHVKHAVARVVSSFKNHICGHSLASLMASCCDLICAVDGLLGFVLIDIS